MNEQDLELLRALYANDRPPDVIGSILAERLRTALTRPGRPAKGSGVDLSEYQFVAGPDGYTPTTEQIPASQDKAFRAAFKGFQRASVTQMLKLLQSDVVVAQTMAVDLFNKALSNSPQSFHFHQLIMDRVDGPVREVWAKMREEEGAEEKKRIEVMGLRRGEIRAPSIEEELDAAPREENGGGEGVASEDGLADSARVQRQARLASALGWQGEGEGALLPERSGAVRGAGGAGAALPVRPGPVRRDAGAGLQAVCEDVPEAPAVRGDWGG